MPRVQEITSTRAHIMEARARQASCNEEQCVYLEYCPDYQSYQYLKAIERVVGGPRNVVQFSKVNGHYLEGLDNKSLAEHLIREGLEIEGTFIRTFPFRKSSTRITVGNLPFFVGDAAIVDALSCYGRITSITPKLLRAGEFTYTDGRREAFILLHDGITIDKLPTRFEIRIKGEAWPAFLSHGIKCSKCHGQGHRKANCPQLHGHSTTFRRASLPSTTNLLPSTAPGLSRQSSAAPPAPALPSPAVGLSGAPPDARAASLPSTALLPSTPAPLASSVQVAAPAPPPMAPAPEDPASPRSAATEPTSPSRPDFVAPCGPLPAQGTLGPATHTPDVDMTTIEETSASSPAAVIPTPPLPAPQPAGPTPPAPHEEETTPTVKTPSPLLLEQEENIIVEIFRKLKHTTCLKPSYESGIHPNELKSAILFTDDRVSLMAELSPALKGVLAEFLGAAIELAQNYHPIVGFDMAKLRRRCLNSCRLLWREPDSGRLVCMPVETRGQKMASEELLKQFMSLMRQEKEKEKEEKLKRKEEKEEKLKREKEEEERRREEKEEKLRREKEEEERRREQEKEEKLKRKEEKEEKLKREKEEEERRREQEKEEKLKRKEEKEEKLKREKEEEERRREQEKEEKLKRKEEKEEKLKREKEEEERRREQEKEEKLKREKEEEERRREEKEEKLKRREEKEERWTKMLSGIGVEAQGQHKDVDKRIKSLESEVIALQEEPSTAERARRSAEVERDDLAEEANSKASRVTMLQDDKRRLENAGSLLEGQAKAEGLAERAHRAQSSVDLLTTEVAAERASCGKLENAGSLLEGQAKAEGLAERAHRAQSSVDLLTTEVAAERASCQKLENAGSLLEGQGKELRAKLQERETSQRARTKATIASLESQTCQLEEQLEAEGKELRAKLQERETSQRARTKATIAGLESQTCQLEEQLKAEGKELRAKLQERETSQRARTKATIAGLESQTCQLEEQLEAEGKERQALAKANRKLDKKVKEMSMQLEEQLEAEGKERQALAKANRKLDKKVEEMSMQLEEQLEAEGKERQALAKANRKLDKKVKEMSMQLEDEHRQAEHYKGKDHDANEAKNMDEVHCTDLRVEEKLDVEQGTDLEVEENLDAEQGTESKVEGEIVDPKDWLKEGLVDRVDEIPPEGKGYWFPDRLVFGCESETTPIRPVFDDASCRGNCGLALRRYLRRRPSLQRRIPEIRIELRKNKLGVLADLKRYFRMMAIKNNAWDYLRFLWKKKMDNDGMVERFGGKTKGRPFEPVGTLPGRAIRVDLIGTISYAAFLCFDSVADPVPSPSPVVDGSVCDSSSGLILPPLLCKNASAFVIKTGSTTQWQADLAPKEMASSDMRNRHHVQPLLTWSTNAAHSVFLD
ncbi:MYH9 [Cordylochernes scorpioides]|uniref:MYH9 n=1 Tax=Cordylochernes scorpioides TaxID=51811 RepID=A0ABY6L1I9_9ARAC|nr:MYH9 [Cordylochernes scorpioides]